MTFSIVARCPRTLTLGVAVSTAVPSVRDRVPYAEAKVGAIATQGKTNILYGVNGLKLMKKAFTPQRALETLLNRDFEGETRQVIMIDIAGRTAAFTGREVNNEMEHIVGEDHAVAGNMLVDKKAVEEMSSVFKSSVGDLAERLMRALEAGQRAGGDKRGKASAALLVTNGEKTTHPLVDLRVDDHPEPLLELRRKLVSFLEHRHV